MSSNEARADALVTALRAAIARDRDTVRAAVTDDVRVWSPMGSTSGVDELLAALDERDDSVTDVVVELVPLDVGGDFACAEWTMVAVSAGESFSTHGVTVAEFEGERICAVRHYSDEVTLFVDFGVTPE